MRTVAGFDASRAAAVAAGVPAASVEAVPFDASEAMIHTRNESVFLARHCKARGYWRVLVCAPPIHAVRAFATACSAAIDEECSRLLLYCWPGDADPWIETVTHSQGTTRGTRTDLLDGELDRIRRYTAKRDILPAGHLISFIDARDRDDADPMFESSSRP